MKILICALFGHKTKGVSVALRLRGGLYRGAWCRRCGLFYLGGIQ